MSFIARSNELIATVRHYLDTVQTLTETARHILEGGITQLQKCNCTIRCCAHQSVYERTEAELRCAERTLSASESARRTHG